MFDVSDDAKGEFRRVELLTGPGHRRRWSAEAKAEIVAETLVPGARVSEVARRWQVCTQQVFGWRRAMRQDLPSVRTRPSTATFVPIVTEAVPSATIARAAPPGSVCPDATKSVVFGPDRRQVIEVKLAGAVVRVAGGLDDAAQLTAVLRAVRASASRT
jgi:transposase